MGWILFLWAEHFSEVSPFSGHAPHHLLLRSHQTNLHILNYCLNIKKVLQIYKHDLKLLNITFLLIQHFLKYCT